jgi:hypothetical protein
MNYFEFKSKLSLAGGLLENRGRLLKDKRREI